MAAWTKEAKRRAKEERSWLAKITIDGRHTRETGGSIEWAGDLDDKLADALFDVLERIFARDGHDSTTNTLDKFRRSERI